MPAAGIGTAALVPIIFALVGMLSSAYVEQIKALAQRAQSVPQEAAELDARIVRLRERLKDGDPDLTLDELQAALDRAETKRRGLDHSRSTVGNSARILSVLPKAAEYYGQQISLGLDGDPQAAAKARPIVRELLGGKVDLVTRRGWKPVGRVRTAHGSTAARCRNMWSG